MVGLLCVFLIGASNAAIPDKDNDKNFKPMLHYGVGSKGQWRLYIRDPELRSAIGRTIIPANEWCSLVDQPYSERLKVGLTQFARLIKFDFKQIIGGLSIYGYIPLLKNGRINNAVVLAGLSALGAESVGGKRRTEWERDFARAELGLLLDHGKLGFPKDREAAIAGGRNL